MRCFCQLNSVSQNLVSIKYIYLYDDQAVFTVKVQKMYYFLLSKTRGKSSCPILLLLYTFLRDISFTYQAAQRKLYKVLIPDFDSYPQCIVTLLW